MLLIFTFAINPETKEATFSGNVQPAVALKILQDIVIADAVSKAEASKKPKDKEKGKK